MEVFISANSPGEISGWMRPVVRRMKEKCPHSRITVLLLPCPFASGRELQVAKSLPEVDRVLSVSETLGLIVNPKKIKTSPSGYLIHLGGDPLFAVILSLRLQIRLWAYLWAQKHWEWRFQGYFVRDEDNKRRLLNKKIPEAKIQVVGDLIVDSVRFRAEKSEPVIPYAGLTITFMPGSRLHEVTTIMPLFAETAEKIRDEFPMSRFFMPLSPFIERSALEKKSPLKPYENGMGTPIHYKDGDFWTEDELRIQIVDDSIQAMSESDFVITIPGTSTAEAGVLAVPAYCIMPLNKPEHIPFEGPLGLINYLPFIGKPIKQLVMNLLKSRTGLLALPNIQAGKCIIPESIETITPELLFERILPFLRDPEKRLEIKKELTDLYTPHYGAASAIVDAVLAFDERSSSWTPGQSNENQ